MKEYVYSISKITLFLSGLIMFICVIFGIWGMWNLNAFLTGFTTFCFSAILLVFTYEWGYY